MSARTVRTPDGFNKASTPPVYLQVAAADSPVDLSAERATAITQVDATAGAVSIAMPSAQNFQGIFVVQNASAANNTTLVGDGTDTFENNLGSAVLNLVGTFAYAPVRYALGGFGWARIAGEQP